jgi:hypothetical protein
MMDQTFLVIFAFYSMRSRKIIKKLLQITAVLLLFVLAIPAIAFLLLQSSQIQNAIAGRIMQVVSEKLDTKFTISNINISFLYRIRMNDVYLEDLSGDTLIYAESITTGIRLINPVKQKISIGSINFNKAFVRLALDSSGNLNLRYFIDRVKGNGKGKGGWTVDFNNLRLRDGRFRLKNYYSQPDDFGVNYTDMKLSDIDADIKRFKPSPDSLSFFIRSFHFNERSGFVLKNLTGEFSESKNFLSFRDLEMRTPDSNIQGKEITLRFNSWSHFKADSFTRFVRLSVDLKHSKLNLKDIGYFAPTFRYSDQLISITGRVNGPISNLKGKKLEIGFGNHSRLEGEISFQGLPDIRETFILADIRELTTSASDISILQLPGQKRIKLPNQVGKLGLITYKGKFTGFINDFVAYGRFNTAIGLVNTDLLFRPDTSDYLDFEGKLTAQDFDLGKLLDASENIGRISLSATINGAILSARSIDASLKGMIQRFEFKKYEYTNISLSGNLYNKTYNGSVNIHDPNIELEFMGKVNLTDSIPAFDFTANITDANLYALNLDKSDPDFRVSCYLIANARGRSINSLNGEVKLLNSLFVKKDRQLQIYDFSIFAESVSGFNKILLRSDFMDMDIAGDYELSKTPETIKHFILSYLPALSDSAGLKAFTIKHAMDLTATIKNARPLLDFFLPDYYIAENSKLTLSYKPQNQFLQVLFQTSKITVKGITWNDLSALIQGNGDSLSLEAGGKNLMVGDRIKLDNFTLLSNIENNATDVHVRWNNWQDLQHKGNISALGKITRQAGKSKPSFEIALRPASFTANDTLWSIQPGRINIDSSNIRFSNIVISHGDEYFRIEGALSENPIDDLNLQFNRFNLGNLNGITGASGYKLGGILNGRASLSDIYGNKLFTSLLKIDSLMINNEMLGNAEISSTWDDDRKAVEVQAHAMRDNLKTISIDGEYLPTRQGQLDFKVSLDKLRMNIFNPYVKVIFSDLRGIASGKATLTGTLSKPLLNGELNLQKTTFTVNYLKTRYNFTEKVQVENNNIYFKDVRIYDPKGNSAYLNGAIRNRYLKDFQLDLTIRSQDFLCMNTTETDNKLFYGTAYATGNIRIHGPPKNITMDISATTDKNTSIKIPLTNTGELDEFQFITIVNEYPDQAGPATDDEYQVDLSGMQINFDLTVTPDAEVQMIFDPKLGDIIKGRGNGNLNMRINTSGNFLMFGEYIIEEGDYLFTLQNIINKKLNIEPGGTIRWNGDPFDATIDIVANYPTKASLKDLLGNSDDRKIIVHDRVTMTGRLMAPDVKYDIYLPNADESTRLNVSSAITSTEELNKQFISLLTLNRFVLSTTRTGMAQSTQTASPYSSAAGVNASEFLSNQLSHWLSQINNDVDVGVNYRSNREMKSDEVEVALSTQLFNDRLTINGSVDVATNAAATTATDNIVGEFDIDYKITKNGKFRVKTYNHINSDMLYENLYTQGFGVFYKEEFNTLGELWRQYLRSVVGKKEEEPVLQEDPDKGS